ncbi:MAG: DUF2892 domain-containing protein [Calditrichaeota bacterium]|nr:DUF2892 domain-containing protein [Candidatus Cloacimonadota bacterium]MCB1048220.1 DUF2892 domain-containing protein [Calditrichota bacterium]
MGMHQALRLLAGSMVLLSLLLSRYVHPGFFWLGIFVGVNLLQSAFSRNCPAIWFFRKLGLREDR